MVIALQCLLNQCFWHSSVIAEVQILIYYDKKLFSFSFRFFFKLITIFPWEGWVGNGFVFTLSSVGLWRGSLHGLINGWCLQMFGEMFNGTGSALPQSSCTFIAQLMGTGAENPGCFQLENACWQVLFIKCLLCLLSTVDLHGCSRSSTFQPGWICSVPSLCADHIPNHCDTSWWNGLLAVLWVTEVSQFPFGMCRQEMNEPQVSPNAGWIKQWLSRGLISV